MSEGPHRDAPAPEGVRQDGTLNAWLHEVLARNPDLLHLYLARGDPFRGGDRVSATSKLTFLLWFTVFGKRQYPNICRFDEHLLNVLNTRLPSGATLLRDYLDTLAAEPADPDTGKKPTVDDLVRDHHLGPFLDPTGQVGAAPRRAGVSIVGFPLHTLGLGEDARSLFKVLRHLGVPVSLVDVGNESLERITEAAVYEPFLLPRPIFPTVIFCMPLFEQLRVQSEWGAGALMGRRVVGYWPWELTAFDPCWRDALSSVDAIWASTTFLRDVYRQQSTKPVHHVPMLVDVGEPDIDVLDRYGLAEESFSVLAFADLNSTLTRKNVLGAIKAFQRAFPDRRHDVRLIVKTTHLEGRDAEWATLSEAIDGDDRVTILDGALSRAETLGLLAMVDVFVSLHRAEGFGRVLAEAMAVGTAVVATDWSGSRDLIGPETGYPVACRMVAVAPNQYPEAAGLWAEPDIDEAADILRSLHRDPEGTLPRLARARHHIEDHYSLDAVARIVRERLVELESL